MQYTQNKGHVFASVGADAPPGEAISCQARWEIASGAKRPRNDTSNVLKTFGALHTFYRRFHESHRN